MQKIFKNVEKEFRQLYRDYQQKLITEKEFQKQLKKLRLKDENGRYWTIGAQSGKWYYFDGKDWIESKPPSLQEGKIVCIWCGYENDMSSQSCARCGGTLGKEEEDKISMKRIPDEYDLQDILDKTPEKEPENLKRDSDHFFKNGGTHSMVLSSFSLIPMIRFGGIVGLFMGIILGILTGATVFFPGIVAVLPSFFQRLQGSLFGGISFGFIGGILGYVIISFVFALLTLIMNVILSFTGGIRIKVKETDNQF